jgi:hypothetical protein
MVLLGGCASLQSPSKYQLAEGDYKMEVEEKKVKVYLEQVGDTLVVHTLGTADSMKLPEYAGGDYPSIRLSRPTLDIDIVSVVFKLRAGHSTLPPQINAHFNGNLYVGFRKDIYVIRYRQAYRKFHRQVNHFGFSIGAFSGIGSTPVNPSVTSNTISQEYDGIILQKGWAGIFAINKITMGLGLGFDTLLDRNSRVWIYQERPWLGLVLGLNLN